MCARSTGRARSFGRQKRDRLSRGVAERLVLQRIEARQVHNRDVDAADRAIAVLTPLGLQLFRIAARRVEIRVAVEDQRLTDLPLELRAELPSTQYRVNDRRPVAAPPPFAPDGQFDHRRERDAMRPIDRRDTFFGPFPRFSGVTFSRICDQVYELISMNPLVNRLSARKIIPW